MGWCAYLKDTNNNEIQIPSKTYTKEETTHLEHFKLNSSLLWYSRGYTFVNFTQQMAILAGKSPAASIEQQDRTYDTLTAGARYFPLLLQLYMLGGDFLAYDTAVSLLELYKMR